MVTADRHFVEPFLEFNLLNPSFLCTPLIMTEPGIELLVIKERNQNLRVSRPAVVPVYQ